jgi:hypothetical protein
MTKNVMYVLGAVLIIVGLLGFINNPVLGIFKVDVLHNLVHLASGILAVVFAGMGASQAKTFAVILGVVYALVTILGFLSGESVLGLITVNMADNVLHLVLAIVFLVIGLKKSSGGMAPMNPAM